MVWLQNQKEVVSKSWIFTIGLTQGWEFAFSLFTLLLKIAIFKEQQWAIYSRRSSKRVSVSESLLLLFTKERPWANRSCRSLQKSDVSDLLMICSFALKKIRVFYHVFDSFSLLFSFLCSLVTMSGSLSSIFSKERREQLALFQEQNTVSLFPSPKMSDSHEKPKSKFPIPTLVWQQYAARWDGRERVG